MAGRAALILLFGLVEILARPIEQVAEDSHGLSSVSLKHHDASNTSIAVPPKSTGSVIPGAGKDLKVECDSLCKACNLTGKAVNDSCQCLDSLGSEVTCIVHGNIGKLVGDIDERGDDKFNTEVAEGEDGGLRGERCLGGLMGRARGALQSLLGQDLKDMTTEERLAEFRKRVEALRRRPSESDKTKVAEIPTSPPDRSSLPLFNLPVSPFMNRNLGETLQKDGKESVKIEDVKTDKTVAEKSSVATLAKPPKGLLNPSSPVRRSVGSPVSSETTDYSGIKLPTQFLALTKLRERMVDIDKLPDDDDEPIEKVPVVGVLTYPKPQISISTPVKILPSLKTVDAIVPSTPSSTVPPPTKSTLKEEIVQSNLAVISPVVSDHTEDDVKEVETLQKSSQHFTNTPIMEGIIAIPKHVRIK